MKKSIAITLCFILIMALVLPASAFSSIAVKGIKLDKSKIVLTVGQTYNLKATLSPKNTTQKLLAYTTGNKKIATINEAGKITGVSAGTTTITVYTSNKKISAKCDVTVLKLVKKAYTIKMWVFPFSTEPEKEKSMWDEMIKNFHAEDSEINVNVQTLPWGNREQKMMTALAANKGPDIVYMNPDIMKQFAYNNVLQPLDKYYSDDIKNDIPGNVKEEVKVNGKFYGVPLLIDARAFVYNLDMLKEIGMSKETLPTSYDEYEQMLKALKEKGKYGTYFEFGGSPSNNGLYAQLYSEGNDVILPDGTVVIDNDAGKSVMARLARWYQKGYMPKDALNVQNAMSSFIAGDIASYHISASSELKSKEFQGLKFNWAIGPVLKGAKGTYASSTIGSLSITKDSKDAGASFKWIAWVTNKENMKTFCKLTGYFAPRKSIGDISGGIKGMDVLYNDLQYIRGEIGHPAARQVNPLLIPAVQGIVSGSMSVDAGLAQLKKSIEGVVATLNDVSSLTK